MGSNKKYQVTTFGDCSLDHFVVPTKYSIKKAKGGSLLQFDFASKIPLSDFRLFPGGNALNTAVTFSRLGLATAIAAELGDDLESVVLKNRIDDLGIGTDYLRTSTHETDKSIILITRSERTILSFHCKKNYSFPKNLSTEWLYLTSLGDGFEKVYNQVLNFKKRSDLLIAYNSGSRQLQFALPAVRRMVRASEVVFMNLEEAVKIVGKKLPPKSLLKALHSLGAHNVVITAGPKGAYGFDGHKTYFIKAFPAKRVDATGAGDAFASAATAALIYGQDLPEAMRWGSVNAAGEISQIGVQVGLLSKTALMKKLGAAKSFQAKILR